MEKNIQVAVSKVIINKEFVNVDLPEVPKFYFKNDNGNFFPLGIMLFAIVPRYKKEPTSSYMIYQIHRGHQKSTDFVPTKDCRQEAFLNENIRKEAFDIITGKEPNWVLNKWEEITEDAFLTMKEDLLFIENLTID